MVFLSPQSLQCQCSLPLSSPVIYFLSAHMSYPYYSPFSYGVGNGIQAITFPFGSPKFPFHLPNSFKYKISIPASFATSGEPTSAELSVSEFNIEPNAKVTISVSSSNITLTNENDNSTTWKKSLKVGSNEFTSIDFTNSAQDSKTIILGEDASDTGVKPAGKYSGKVTFSIAYTANPAS